MSKKNKPKVIYANFINGYGLFFKRHIKLTYNKELDSWWDITGDYEAKKIGLSSNKSGCASFTSTDPNEVRLWTLGVRSVMLVLKSFASNHD